MASSMVARGKLRVALCQMLVGPNKPANLAKAAACVSTAKSGGADVVVLPECFNSPYGTKFFSEYAEEIAPHEPSFQCMAEAAKNNAVWIVAGSIPERSGAQLFNSCMVFNPSGELVDVHRKVHLFQINTEAVKFDEAEVLTAGNKSTVVSVDATTKFGIGICFDIRFPQLALAYTDANTSFMVFPGAFNMVTGPAHWALLAKARAVDNQQFVVLCSPARDETAGYVAWGHSMVVDPWGDVIAEAAESEEIVFADMDLDQVQHVRERLPSLKGTRRDLYSVDWERHPV